MIDLDRLQDFKVVAVDVETTGLHWYRDRMFGVAVAGYDGKRIVNDYWDIREKPRIIDALVAGLPRAHLLVNHNIKFDAHFLRESKVSIPLDRIECTSVRAALINEHEPSFSLDALASKYTGRKKVDIWPELAKLFGGDPTRAAQIKNLHRAPSHLASRYASADPELAIRLWLWQQAEIERQELQQVWALERALTPVLIGIEQQGVRVDEELAQRSIKLVDRRIDEAQRALDQIAGKKLNANSPLQMRGLFGATKIQMDDGRYTWRTSDGYPLEATDTGEASVGKAALMQMAQKGDERAKAVLMIRRMTKARSFLKDHILGHAVNGRVYPNYNQTRGDTGFGTVTGRFSVNDPALQQIPMHDRDVAEIVRPCFLPEKGEKWGCADWNQFEFRWFAHYINDPTINKMYEDNANADFHQTVADITGITRDRKFAGDTANAKQINLGLVFGMGEGEMAYNMGMEYTVAVGDDGRVWKRAGTGAKEIFAKYHTAIPGVKALLAKASSIARSRGHVKTAMGRHIRFPGGKFTHKAGGLVFQGTSADCMKAKMVELWPICRKEGWRMLLSVHDELDFSIPGRTARAEKVIRGRLEDFHTDSAVVKCRIPIRTSIDFGNNWWESCR